MCQSRYESAKQLYAQLGIDTEAAIAALSDIRVSVHCWQGDDVAGFENTGGDLSGGIAVTGNYPGQARTPQELMADLDKALSLVPGKQNLNLHAIYAVTDEKVDRDRLEPKHFAAWVDYAKQRGLGLDFNPTLFSHPMAADNLTLSHPDAKVRRFWIDHCKATRRIAEYFGRELGIPSCHNIWIPDGLKDVPGDRQGPRRRLKESLDEIYAEKLDSRYIIDAVESKVFGLGAEAYTVGSHEFYLNYAAKNDILCLLDTGHYHPTEVVSDKISSMLLFSDKVALHVSRPVRWDSDHVVAFDDELRELSREIVRCGVEKTIIALDFFDASINRVAAWVIGIRNMQKALLFALLQPTADLAAYQDKRDFTSLIAIQEELKTYPYADVWDEFCGRADVPLREGWLTDVRDYEEHTTGKRA